MSSALQECSSYYLWFCLFRQLHLGTSTPVTVRLVLRRFKPFVSCIYSCSFVSKVSCTFTGPSPHSQHGLEHGRCNVLNINLGKNPSKTPNHETNSDTLFHELCAMTVTRGSILRSLRHVGLLPLLCEMQSHPTLHPICYLRCGCYVPSISGGRQIIHQGHEPVATTCSRLYAILRL